MSIQKKQQPVASNEKSICGKFINAITSGPAFRRKFGGIPPQHVDDSGRASLQQNKLAAAASGSTVSTGFSEVMKSPVDQMKTTSANDDEVPIIFDTSTHPQEAAEKIRDQPMNRKMYALPDASAVPMVSQLKPKNKVIPTNKKMTESAAVNKSPNKSSSASAKPASMELATAQKNISKKQEGSDKPLLKPAAKIHEDLSHEHIDRAGGSRSKATSGGINIPPADFGGIMNSCLLRNDSFNDEVTRFIDRSKHKFHTMSSSSDSES